MRTSLSLLIRFHRDRRGAIAGIEFMLLLPLIVFVFVIGFSYASLLREHAEVRVALRTSVSNYHFFGKKLGRSVCLPLANGIEIEESAARHVLCTARESAELEERPSKEKFWDAMTRAASSYDLAEEVKPEPLRIIAAKGHVRYSKHAKKLGNPLGLVGNSEPYQLPDWSLWTHEETTFENGHDPKIYSDLGKTKVLFPRVYRKAK